MKDLIAIKLLHDFDFDPEITEKEFIKNGFNLQLDGKRIYTFHTSFLPFFCTIHKFEFA